MPPRVPVIYQTALDPFRQGALRAAKEGLSAEHETFGIGFALVPGTIDPQTGLPTGWIFKRFSSLPEGVFWLQAVEAHGGHVYAAIFTRFVEGPFMESFGHGNGNIDLVTTMITRVPAHWLLPGRDY